MAWGGWSKKVVCIYDDFVAAFYDSCREEWFDNLNKYYDKLHYPKCDYLYIDKNNHLIVCEKVHGMEHIDIDYAEKVINVMLDGMCKETFYEDISYEEYDLNLRRFGIDHYHCCVQHADASMNTQCFVDK